MLRPIFIASVGLLVALAAVPVVAGDACLPLCEVKTVDLRARFAYVPAAIFVQSGSSVAWSALDSAPHTATDRASFCFSVNFAGPAVRSVLFSIADGALFAALPGKEPEECTGAAALPDGSFVLGYECVVHPDAMEGLLVVK